MPELQQEQVFVRTVRVLSVQTCRSRGGVQAEARMKPDKSGAEQPYKREAVQQWADSAELLCVRGQVF